jgi:hypothetical protein
LIPDDNYLTAEQADTIIEELGCTPAQQRHEINNLLNNNSADKAPKKQRRTPRGSSGSGTANTANTSSRRDGMNRKRLYGVLGAVGIVAALGFRACWAPIHPPLRPRVELTVVDKPLRSDGSLDFDDAVGATESNERTAGVVASRLLDFVERRGACNAYSESELEQLRNLTSVDLRLRGSLPEAKRKGGAVASVASKFYFAARCGCKGPQAGTITRAFLSLARYLSTSNVMGPYHSHAVLAAGAAQCAKEGALTLPADERPVFASAESVLRLEHLLIVSELVRFERRAPFLYDAEAALEALNESFAQAEVGRVTSKPSAGFDWAVILANGAQRRQARSRDLGAKYGGLLSELHDDARKSEAVATRALQNIQFVDASN